MKAPKHDQKSGLVMVEAAFIIPLLLVFFFGTVTMMLMFAEYLFMTQQAREVALKGAMTRYLGAAGQAQRECLVPPSKTRVEHCLALTAPPTSADVTCGHDILCWYGHQIFQSRKHYLDPAQLRVKSKIMTHSEEPGLCVVQIEIWATYVGIVPMLSGSPLVVQATSGYITAPFPDFCPLV